MFWCGSKREDLHEGALHLPHVNTRVQGLPQVHHYVSPGGQVARGQMTGDLPEHLVISRQTVHLHQGAAHAVREVIIRIATISSGQMPLVFTFTTAHSKLYPISGVA